MALARWELEQRQRGNTAGAEMARVLREQYGDVSLKDEKGEEAEPSQEDEELAAQRREVWQTLRKQEVELPQEVKIVLERAKEKGIGNLKAYFLPELVFEENTDYPGWDVKPEHWYWEQIRNGNVDSDVPELKGMWVLVDTTQKPNYKDGKQVYSNDQFGNILAQLRKDKKITVPSDYKHVPQNSRFAVSWDELKGHVLPAIAETLGVKTNQVRLPKEIEFNVVGNLFHPEWGQTSTWEWFEDRFGGGDRLYGGGCGFGGLVNVSCSWSDGRNAGIGFRPLIVFSSNA